MDNKFKMTQSGLDALKAELAERLLKREQLREVIEDMRDKGDLSENEGYVLSLEDDLSNEKSIAEIQQMIDNAVIVKETSNTSKVGIGSKVEVESNGVKTLYIIVGDNESDPLANKISASSPIGSALMNKKVGDSVEVQLPKGVTKYTILSIKAVNS